MGPSFFKPRLRGMQGGARSMATGIWLVSLVSALSPHAEAILGRGRSFSSRPSLMRLRGGRVSFDSGLARECLEKMWNRDAWLGVETQPHRIYFEEILADRFCLTGPFQLIRDELTLSFNRPRSSHGRQLLFNQTRVADCAIDLAHPSCFTTLGYTTCGDRICMQSADTYKLAVASRFASMTEYGDTKFEFFLPMGGGTDSGPSLAHVTMSHNFESDPRIKAAVYKGNSKSFVLVNIDITTHCGRFDMGASKVESFLGNEYSDVTAIYGMAQESVFRDPRQCCYSIIRMLRNFKLSNAVHVRLRKQLGEANYNFLRSNEILADDGSPVTYLVAASIIAVQGMYDTLEALGPGGELDERGLGHVTASVCLNKEGQEDRLLLCAKGTVFKSQMTVQGLGTDATVSPCPSLHCEIENKKPQDRTNVWFLVFDLGVCAPAAIRAGLTRRIAAAVRR
mmetsp:Transcript_38523/g.90973  ORF Transcript_38523/g.90973 Transcript_38523/m.90973 type:complete len:452 (-) Transcript_38523:361-1716(-)